MSRHIEKLDSLVLKRLKSQVYAVSLASAVREIVQNSIDAHASNVDVLIDLSNLSFAVYDDGTGSVSYTHLDVYKRQAIGPINMFGNYCSQG